jgi:hypothetical protein
MPAPATARKGRLQTQEWRSDGRAEWDGAECTYYRRAGAMPAAVVAGDGCGFVHAVWELVLSPGPEYSHYTRQRTATNVGPNLEGPLAVASYHPNAPCGPGLGAEGANWTSLKERPPGTIRGSDSSDQVGNCPL